MIKETDKNIKNSNEIKIFERDDYEIEIQNESSNDKISIKTICPNLKVMQNSFSYKELINKVRPLAANKDINELFINLVELFDLNEYTLKEGENNLEIILQVYNNKGVKENYSIILNEKENDTNELQRLIRKKIIKLEEINKQLKNENKNLKENNRTLSEEIKELKKSIEEIKLLLNKKEGYKENIKDINYKDISINSKILSTESEYNFIFEQIQIQTKKIPSKFILLYRASENGGSGEKFHEKCDDRTPTIVIIHSKNNFKFGGYTEKSWSKVSTDDNAFCFSIDLQKIYKIKNKEIAIYGGEEGYGPIFYGESFNFIEIGKSAFSNDNHCCKSISSYNGVVEDYEINGGIEKFNIFDYEVFQIIFD